MRYFIVDLTLEPMKKELIKTEDGSHTIFVPELNEHYHSTHGAIQESEHVFIKEGYEKISKKLKIVNVLEVGFGTGLNAFLTFLIVKNKVKKVNYIGIEPSPVDENIYKKLNYPQMISPRNKEDFIRMHETNWKVPFFITDNFILNKIQSKIEDITLQPKRFHLVYFDAFAPSVQPELWEEDVFKKIHKAMQPQGILVTYSSKGTVKRALEKVGFQVELIPGPEGKREITRAIKK
jgi:tRNA U34 5-methylaminomethyl-2-thiouridine-forming methyltransferase MnmC